MDTFDRPTTAQVAAIRSEDHVVWDEPDAFDRDRIELRFVATTWLLGLAATVAILVVSASVASQLIDRTITGDVDQVLGVLTLLGAFSTLLGFIGVLVARLVRVEHDRVVNSLTVGLLHLVVGTIVLVGILLLEDAGGIIDSVGGDLVTVLARTALAGFVASLLAIGLVPARGTLPDGTQTERTDTDHML